VKKSNDPEGAREAKRKSDWDKTIFRAGIPRLPGGRNPGQEYNRVMSSAFLKWKLHGRRAAIEYLSSCRPWLIQYSERVGTGELPASGRILDALIISRTMEQKQPKKGEK
jgi:hypothetical protein